MTELRLTEQEIKVTNYLQAKNNQEISWEELVQFSKTPQSVKKNTIQKVVSEIKRKYVRAGLNVPFSVTFKNMTALPICNEDRQAQNLFKESVVTRPLNFKFDPMQVERLNEALDKSEQKFIKIPRLEPKSHQAQLDFILDVFSKRVRTKYGYKQLGDAEWDVFRYIHANPGRIISINELRDKVVFPQYGSKLPPKWYDTVMRIVNNLRRQVDGLKVRLMTIGAFNSGETGYIFQ